MLGYDSANNNWRIKMFYRAGKDSFIYIVGMLVFETVYAV